MGMPGLTTRAASLRTLAELVRAPAALSVPGDTFAGGAAAGWPFGSRTPALAASSVCLYWAGMALNDYTDRLVDAAERPSRPIPSGRVTPEFAFGTAVAMTVGGVAIAGVAGGWRAVTVALPLAGTIWAYDLALKTGPAGPAAMAAARALDVLMGAGALRMRAALPAAFTVGAHTLAVTLLSRGEVTGTDRRIPLTTLALTLLAAGQAATVPAGGPSRRLVTRVLLSAYTARFSQAQLAAVRNPEAPVVQRAVATGILALLPLQGALAARSGATRTALAIVAAYPLAQRLARRISPT